MEMTRTSTKIPTRKLVLWVGIISIVMLFAGLTSGYIVRQAEGNWTQFELPFFFWISTALIIASSVTFNIANKSVKENKFEKCSTFLLLTLLLGIGFMISQYLGWSKLVSQGIYFVGNPSGSFLYVITGLHVLHVVAGILALAVTLYNSYQKKYSSENKLGLQLTGIYWHFLGALWVYLFFFLLLIR
jgi:cytochrome c oxidase subunit III